MLRARSCCNLVLLGVVHSGHQNLQLGTIPNSVLGVQSQFNPITVCCQIFFLIADFYISCWQTYVHLFSNNGLSVDRAHSMMFPHGGFRLGRSKVIQWTLVLGPVVKVEYLISERQRQSVQRQPSALLPWHPHHSIRPPPSSYDATCK